MRRISVMLIAGLVLLYGQIAFAGEEDISNSNMESNQEQEIQSNPNAVSTDENVSDEKELSENKDDENIVEEDKTDKNASGENASDENASEEEIIINKGWYFRAGEGYYYYNEDGSLYSGWLRWKNRWTYLDGANTEYPGIMARSERKEINGKTYFFDENGYMRTGWVGYEGNWYYASNNGNLLSGWLRLGKVWYYLERENPDNPFAMLADTTRVIGKHTYHFNKNGSMKTGWHWETGYYYYNENGQRVAGWLFWNKKWYYLNPAESGKMLHDTWQWMGSTRYYFLKNGDMAQGWTSIGKKWYYMSGTGAATTGWKKIDSKWYYFYVTNDRYGEMARNTTIGSYYIDAHGVYQTAVFANKSSNDILSIARSGVGYPYVYGGTTTSGWDCSGYVTWVARQLGANLGRTTDDISRICSDALVASGSSTAQFHSDYDSGRIRPGDIVVFSTYSGTTVHTGIVGENKSLYHAWYPKVGTIKSDFDFVLRVDVGSYQVYKIYRGAGK